MGAFSGKFDEKSLVDRATAALHLIAEADARRYTRIRRHLRRILIGAFPGRLAQYAHKWRLCQLDDSFVKDPETTINEIASTIIHEATHARIAQRGLAYHLDRQRHEHICLEEERAFVSRLPESGRVLARIEHLRSKEPMFWEQTDARTRTASEKALVELGLPKWLIRTILYFSGERAV